MSINSNKWFRHPICVFLLFFSPDYLHDTIVMRMRESMRFKFSVRCYLIDQNMLYILNEYKMQYAYDNVESSIYLGCEFNISDQLRHVKSVFIFIHVLNVIWINNHRYFSIFFLCIVFVFTLFSTSKYPIIKRHWTEWYHYEIHLHFLYWKFDQIFSFQNSTYRMSAENLFNRLINSMTIIK